MFIQQLKFRRIGLIWMAALLMPLWAGAQTGGRLFDAEDDPDAPWEITADVIEYDQATDLYHARGNVTIVKKDRKLTADAVEFNHRAMTVRARGRVLMIAGSDAAAGERMTVNLRTETGAIRGGSVFLAENHFYIRGDRIIKTGKNSYAAENASLTSCDGETPAWRITARKLDVTVEGYGVLRHGTFRIKNIPVLYTPFLIFPVKLERQTGLLAPEFGVSDRKGTEYIQPFFWAVSPSADATFYEHYMSKRGNKLGAEFRYALDDASRGAVMFDFLQDRQTDDGSPDAMEDWGYDDDLGPRPNADRYWFRAKMDQDMPLGFSAKVDLDVASDQDYLHEFKTGYTGYETTRAYFYDVFGRDLDDDNNPVRTNRVNISRTGTASVLSFETLWYDDVLDRRLDEPYIYKEYETNFHRLPSAAYTTVKQEIFDTGLYYDLDSDYIYLYSDDAGRVHRTDIHPRVYFPVQLKQIAVLEPSVGVRETVWHVDEYNSAWNRDDRTMTRELYDFQTDLSSSLYRTFAVNGKTIDKIRHLVRPGILYEYIPGLDQDEYPYVDAADRVEKINQVTFSVTNTFTARSPVRKTGTAETANAAPAYAYHQFCRLKLEQTYDFNEAMEEDHDLWLDPEERRPFLPLYGELELAPVRFLSFTADAEWNHYEGRFESRNLGAVLRDDRGDVLLAEHRYTYDYSESFYASCGVRITDRLTAYGEYERNEFDSEDLKKGLGLLYQAQCWSADLSYMKEEGDERVMVKFNLSGLGGAGGSL